jgi:hypothetical protein
MKTILSALALTAVLATPVFAGQCDDDLAAIDKALNGEGLAADVKSQAMDMRKQAEQLCKAGNQDEGLAMTAEAKTLLQLD